MSRPVVYVLQKHLIRSHTGIRVPKFDLTPAAKFGDLNFILGPDARGGDPDAVALIRRGLADLTEDDYLLPIGSTILISILGALANERCARLNFLYWSSSREDYVVTTHEF